MDGPGHGSAGPREEPGAAFPSDEAAMRAVQAGHLGVLGVLYERHSRRVLAQCRRMVQGGEVDDLVQEAFLRVLRYRASFRGDARFTSWLYAITRNVCLDHLRRRGRHEEEAAGDAAALGATQAQGEGERVAVLRQALDRLPPEKRELVLLCRLQGLSYAQLSQRLGLKEGTIRVRVHRALAELKATFDALWEEAP